MTLRLAAWRTATLTGLISTLLVACSGSADTDCGGIVEPVRVVTLTPQSVTVDPGAGAQVNASLTGGCSTDERGVRWAMADAAIATVDQTGRITGVAAGSTTLTASAFADRATSSIPVTVRPRTATTLSLTPELDTLSPLGTRPLVATVRDQTGGVLAAAPVTYRSLTPNVATVSVAGVVSAIAAGTALIEAATPTAGADSLRDTVRVLIVTACALVRPLQLGATTPGRIDASTCQNLSGYRVANQYSITADSQAYYAVRLAPTLPMALVPLRVNGTQHGLPVADSAVTGFVVTRAGTFELMATAPATTAGTFTITTQLDPDPRLLCAVTDVTLGVAFRTALVPGCLGRDVRILPPLTAAKQLRVTGTATTFPVTLELRNASSGALLQRSIATAAGAQATINYTNSTAGQLVRVRVFGPANANDYVSITVAP